MPNLDMRWLNWNFPKAFVSTSASCSFVPIYNAVITPDFRASRTRWQSISTCLVLHMFSTFMENWIRSYIDCRLTVAKSSSWFIWRKPQIS
ncbi:hypothetical protein YC2023_061291 [Brassica napus]